MTKQEFLDTLGRALRSELSDYEVADNLRYYENYIIQEMQRGKSEAQVLDELGDPRLIARTIVDVDQQKEDVVDSGETIFTEDQRGAYREEQNGDRFGGFGGNVRVHTFSGMKGWLILILILVILFLILGTAFAILWKLLPVILVIAAAYWIYNRLRG